MKLTPSDRAHAGEQLRGAACSSLPTEWWYPTKRAGELVDEQPVVSVVPVEVGTPTVVDNHAAQAKAICATCPIRLGCLLGALDRGEEFGIWGGAGEATRRALRQARRKGALALEEALAAHFRALDGRDDQVPLLAFGPGATHGRPGTYAKGCRCDSCELAASMRTQQARFGKAQTNNDTAGRAA